MALKKQNVAETLFSLAEPLAVELGLTLWDSVFAKEGPSWFLRLVIDKPGGVFIDDCEALSRAVDPLLEDMAIEQEYFFEVSSPGLSRQLKSDRHLFAYRGKEVRLKLYKQDSNGEKDFCGVLLDFDGDMLSLDSGSEKMSFHRGDIADIRANDDQDILGGMKKK